MRIKAFALAIAMALLAAFPIERGQANPHVWGVRDPNYAVLPGVSIGAIAIGTPLGLARQAALRYGYESIDMGSDGSLWLVYGDHLAFSWADGKVDRIIAYLDSQFYLVVPGDEDNFPHVLSARAGNVVAALGVDGMTSNGDLLLWDDYGIILLKDHNTGMLLGYGVFQPTKP